MSEINNHDQSDVQLVTAIKHDDHNAFKLFYYKYFKLLIRFAWYRLYSMDVARDLVQETFYRVWIKRHGLNPDKSVKAYLYKTLTNLIINYRKLHSSSNVSIENDIEQNTLRTAEKIEFQLDIINSINRLPEKIKSVYILSRYDGFDYTEIAEICNISKKAVEKRMSKAFILLRKIFNPKYFE